MPENSERGFPHLPQTSGEFAALAGFNPVEGDNPHSPDRHFSREFPIPFWMDHKYSGFRVGMAVQQLLPPAGKRVDLSVYPMADGKIIGSSKKYDIAERFPDEVAEFLNAQGSLDVKKLKNGGYIKLAALIERLYLTGEFQAVAEYLTFAHNYTPDFAPGKKLESLHEMLQNLDEYRPVPPEKEWEPLAETISTPEAFAHALGFYMEVQFVDPAPKWHCFVKQVADYRVQLLIEERQYAPDKSLLPPGTIPPVPYGIQIFMRALSDDEDLGSWQWKQDNVGLYHRDSLRAQMPGLVDDVGIFNIPLLESGGYMQLVTLMREFESAGLLDAMYQGRKLLRKYKDKPLKFHEEIMPRISREDANAPHEPHEAISSSDMPA